MQMFIEKIAELCTTFAGKILAAIVILIVGNIVIKAITKRVKQAKFLDKIDATVRSFVESIISAVLYVILVVLIVSVIGIPMTSIVAVITAAAATIGLALQGALSNFAGGIMIMFFHPFKVGDYVDTSSGSGTVTNIAIFYTTINTADNKQIIIPNGSLMNAAVTNYSTEPLRRVDIDFCTAFGTDSEVVKGILVEAGKNNPLVTEETNEVFAKISGYNDNGVKYTLRAWCKGDDYWDTYFSLIQAVNDGFAAKGIPAPATNVNVASK